MPWLWGLANMLFKTVKKNMGLDQCKYFMSAAAPIMKETLDFFYSFDIPVVEVYGMSECTGKFTQHDTSHGISHDTSHDISHYIVTRYITRRYLYISHHTAFDLLL